MKRVRLFVTVAAVLALLTASFVAAPAVAQEDWWEEVGSQESSWEWWDWFDVDEVTDVDANDDGTWEFEGIGEAGDEQAELEWVCDEAGNCWLTDVDLL